MDHDAPAPPATRSAARTAAVLLLGAALGAGAGLLTGWIDRTPADPHDDPAFGAAPTRAARAASSGQVGTFRLVTWNVHGLREADGDANPGLTVQWLLASGFDVALLQEAAGPAASGAAAIPARLGPLTGASAAFVGTERRFGEEHTGNAVLSKLPAGPVHRVPLPDTRGKAFRTAVLTTVFVPTEADPEGVPVRVLNVHLTKPHLEPGQIERAIDLFLALETPCVLAGDFNQPIDSPVLSGVLAEEGVTDALAALDPSVVRAALPVGKEKVDHVLVRGLTIGEAAVIPTEASDHPLYWVELTLPTERQPEARAEAE
ncbi:endonuclease/exonuclease/phosphatase family protein [Alienimonas sp. DA493]|uniref:endonuclease/exonuclease/phosphatase family protein n=1 Tax=Alienimonas sp. DA493 TaxID=3373605 RepID=UPI003754C987